MGGQRIMATYHKGFKDIEVRLINCDGNDLAKHVYEFGRLSHDYNEVLPEHYDEHDENCTKLIDKIIAGTTLPKYAMQGHRLDFEIKGISRICLAQLTRDHAIFASQGGGVYPLTEDFNIPLSIYYNPEVMELLKKGQYYLELAYQAAAEAEIPALEARYIGLHCQTISLTASYLPTDFTRSCYSRTSSNFCDECNYIYRKMYAAVKAMISKLTDENSIKLWNWLVNERNCMNDGLYTRERLYNSDFTTLGEPNDKITTIAINDWRKSGWKLELERMYNEEPELLTKHEQDLIVEWIFAEVTGKTLKTTYSSDNPESLCNAIKKMPYYKEKKDGSKND